LRLCALAGNNFSRCFQRREKGSRKGAKAQRKIKVSGNRNNKLLTFMRFDVLIEYDKKLSEVTYRSKAAQFTKTRPSRIGLSRPFDGDPAHEMIEFVGEDWELVKNIHNLFRKEPTRKDQVLRVVNPFEPATFEPRVAYMMIVFFTISILQKFYPRTWKWRFEVPWFDSFDITLNIPGYDYFDPEKKAAFEKMLRKRYKRLSFIAGK
jgi:hypothetical protein